MIGRALKIIRQFHYLSQTDAAKKLDISNSYLSEIENEKKPPNLEILNKYSQEFNLPLSSILFFSENLENGAIPDKIRIGVSSKILDILEKIANQ